MPLSRVAAIFALLMPASSVAAQSNLGQLLDAGGEKLSAEQFKRELVGRPMSGPTSTGQNLDVVYLINGEIRGTGTYAVTGGFPQGSAYDITGVWTVDANDRICTTMVLGRVILPPRCQYWYEYDKHYFFTDSDSDRSARVLRRTLKR